MAEMTMLPFEILNVIMILVATSTHGARDLARVRATCKLLKASVARSNVLRVVNFQCSTLIDNFAMHCHPYDLFMCARVGNEAAESILGKAILNNNMWLWNTTLENDPHVVDDNGSSSSIPLQHPRLVRSFIHHASSKDIVNMHYNLCRYMISFAGYKAYREHGMFNAISNMCCYELTRLGMLTSFTCETQDLRVRFFFPLRDKRMPVVLPPYDVAPRKEALVIFDKLFPFTHV